MRLFAAFALVLLGGCYKTVELPQAPLPGPTVAVVAKYPKASVRRTMEDGVKNGLRLPVFFIDPFSIRTPLEAQTEAAIGFSNFVVILHPSDRDEANFIIGSAYEVTGGKLLGEASFPIASEAELENGVREWTSNLVPNLTASSKPEFKQFARRLKEEKACNLVARLSSEVQGLTDSEQKEIDQVLLHCRPILIQNMYIPRSQLMTIHFTNVPTTIRRPLSNQMLYSEIPKRALDISFQSAEFRIECKNGCREGRMELMLDFDPELYHMHVGNPSDLLSPLRTLAGLLERYVSDLHMALAPNTAKAIDVMPKQIVLRDYPNFWRIDLIQSSDGYVLKPQAGVENHIKDKVLRNKQ